MPSLTSFPRCCGIVVAYGFGNSATNGDPPLTDSQIDTWLSGARADFDSYSMAMVTLNERQEPQMVPLLEKHGFVRIAKPSYHKKHNSYISVYIKRTVPLKKKEVKQA